MMKKYWKQLEGLATGLKANIFLQARLKLTIYYIVSVTIVLSIFSVALYYSLESNLRDGLDDVGNNQTQNAAIDRTIDNLQRTILLTDMIVLILAIFLSWLLAGETLAPIKKSLEAQKQFSANASHEFRTPLAIMKTDSEVTLRNPSSSLEDFRKLAVSNLDEVDRMSKIAEDLIVLSRSESLSCDFAEVDLSEVIYNVIDEIKTLANVKSVEINYNHPKKIFVFGKINDLERMTINILQNAINYSSEFGKIFVHLKSFDKFVELEIKDNGIGIKAKDLPHIFERFYKADKSRSGKTNGSGLGLSIVSEIIRNHHGNIAVNSDGVRGTTVLIKLPKNISNIK